MPILLLQVSAGSWDKVQSHTEPESSDFEPVLHDQPDSKASSKNASPTPSMLARVFDPDSPEKRAENFQKLRDIVASLSQLSAKLKHDHVLASGSEQPAASSNVDVPMAAAEEQPDFGGDDDAVALGAGLDEIGQKSTSEEMARLTDLLAEQQAFLQKMQQEAEDRKLLEADKFLLDDIHHGRTEAALGKIERMRPEQLQAISDLAGMTALHHAVRSGNLPLVFALSERAPELANVATKIERTPPCWTALMILADKGPRQCDPQMCAVLAASMSAAGLNIRSGTYSNVSHMAAARGNLQLLKKVFYRLHDLTGATGVRSHLMTANSLAPWF